MLKQYLMEAGFWLLTVVGPILLVWVGRWFASMLNKWGSRVADALGPLIDHLIEKSKSALVDKGLEEVKSLIGPIVIHAFATTSKEIMEMLADGKITEDEAKRLLENVGKSVKADVKAATSVWKERMKPYLGDTDKLIEAVTEEIYEVVKRNFQRRNSLPAPDPAAGSATPEPK